MPTPNPLTRRDHAGAATPAVTTISMSVSDLSINISTVLGWPAGGVGPFFCVIDPGQANEEKVLVQSRSSNVLTLASGGRGQDGTPAAAHGVGARIYPCWTGVEADESNAHGAALSGVHGISGAVVGTTDAQTLTNKTIVGTSNTLSGIPESAVTGLTTDLAARQPLNSNLTSVAGLSGAGLIAQTLGGSFIGRTITAASSKVSISNGSGQVSDPTIDVVPANFTGIPQSGVTGLAAAWASWTPTYTGITAGNATVTSKYIQVGKTVSARWYFVAGSTTTFSGTTLAVSLPVAAHADYNAGSGVGMPLGTVWMIDASVGVNGRYTGGAFYWNTAGGSAFFLTSINTAAAHSGADTVSSTAPFVPAVNDQFAFIVTYEAA